MYIITGCLIEKYKYIGKYLTDRRNFNAKILTVLQIPEKSVNLLNDGINLQY